LEYHLLVIVCTPNGLGTSGGRWDDQLADVLQCMSFFLCMAESDIWMQDCDTHYQYLLIYVDDLILIGNNPQGFYDTLINENGFQLKGSMGSSIPC
jgi:hypothetical protein